MWKICPYLKATLNPNFERKKTFLPQWTEQIGIPSYLIPKWDQQHLRLLRLLFQRRTKYQGAIVAYSGPHLPVLTFSFNLDNPLPVACVSATAAILYPVHSVTEISTILVWALGNLNNLVNTYVFFEMATNSWVFRITSCVIGQAGCNQISKSHLKDPPQSVWRRDLI